MELDQRGKGKSDTPSFLFFFFVTSFYLSSFCLRFLITHLSVFFAIHLEAKGQSLEGVRAEGPCSRNS